MRDTRTSMPQTLHRRSISLFIHTAFTQKEDSFLLDRVPCLASCPHLYLYHYPCWNLRINLPTTLPDLWPPAVSLQLLCQGHLFILNSFFFFLNPVPCRTFSVFALPACPLCLSLLLLIFCSRLFADLSPPRFGNNTPDYVWGEQTIAIITWNL